MAAVVAVACGCGVPSADLPVPHGLNGGCGPDVLAAIGRQDDAALQTLKARGAKTRCPDTTHLMLRAVTESDYSQLVRLLEVGADPNGNWGDYCYPPLTLAYGKRLMGAADYRAIELLLKSGADPNRRWAPGCGGVTAGPWPDVQGVTPLMLSAAASDARFAGLLLAAGADPNARDSAGRTALFYAQRGEGAGMDDVVKLLTEAR